MNKNDLKILKDFIDSGYVAWQYFHKRYNEVIHSDEKYDETLEFLYGIVRSNYDILVSSYNYCLDIRDRLANLSSGTDVCNLYVEGNFVDDQF